MIALSLALLTLNIIGLFVPISEHPKAVQTQFHKQGLVRPAYAAALQALDRLDPRLPTEVQLATANRIIAARVVHYWPDPDEIDVHVMHSFYENWYFATIQRIESWLAKIGLAEIDLARVGRRDFRHIMAKGVGLCGSKAFALVDYFDERGRKLKVLALRGHVVAYASDGGRNYILDPDYNVVIADVPTPPTRSMPKITDAYSKAGYSGDGLEKIERIYAQSSMKLFALENFQERWRRSIYLARFLKWLIPILLLALGVLVLWWTRGTTG